MQLFIITAIVCLLAVFVSGSAYAQGNLDQIIAEYLAEFQQNTGQTLEDLDRITRDLRECYNEFDFCQDPGDDSSDLFPVHLSFEREIPTTAMGGTDGCIEAVALLPGHLPAQAKKSTLFLAPGSCQKSVQGWEKP